MKLLLSISLIFSFVVSADDHETPEYKYEPIPGSEPSKV